MKEDETRQQLIEVAELRRRLAEVELAETERKRAEEALKEYSERLEEMVEDRTQPKALTS